MIQTLIHAFVGTRPGSVLVLAIGYVLAFVVTAVWFVVSLAVVWPCRLAAAAWDLGRNGGAP